MARTELAAQLRDDAEAAGMVAAFGDLDVSRRFGRGQHARRGFVVKIIGQIGDCAVPLRAGETSTLLARHAFSTRRHTRLQGLAVRAVIQDDEWRIVGRSAASVDSGSGQNGIEFAGTDHGVHFRNVLLDFRAIALHQASGDDQFLRLAGDLVLRHLQDRVDRFLLGRIDKRAGIYHDHVGVFGAGGDLRAAGLQHAHHHLAIDEVLGAAKADKADLQRALRGGRIRLRRR